MRLAGYHLEFTHDPVDRMSTCAIYVEGGEKPIVTGEAQCAFRTTYKVDKTACTVTPVVVWVDAFSRRAGRVKAFTDALCKLTEGLPRLQGRQERTRIWEEWWALRPQDRISY